MAFKEPGGSLPPLHKLAIGHYLQQDLSILFVCWGRIKESVQFRGLSEGFVTLKLEDHP